MLLVLWFLVMGVSGVVYHAEGQKLGSHNGELEACCRVLKEMCKIMFHAQTP